MTPSDASLIPFPSESGAHRDWPEDFASENGCYSNVCLGCRQRFLGHKRRMVCKQCTTVEALEIKRRDDWLRAHDAPPEWVVLTKAEVRDLKVAQVNAVWELHRERALRRKLASTALDLTNNRPWRASLAAVAEESLALDAELAEREGKAVVSTLP